jgi:hypothetical protein
MIGYLDGAIREGYQMDEVARGIAMAGLILQSGVLRSLIANGTMTPG